MISENNLFFPDFLKKNHDFYNVVVVSSKNYSIQFYSMFFGFIKS